MLGLLLAWVSAAAALQPPHSQQFASAGSYSFWTFPALNVGLWARPSRLTATENVVQLRKTNSPSTSAAILQSLRYQAVLQDANATATIQNVEQGQVFVADITVGGQSFDVVIDTGSSDPWLVATSFQCFDPATGDAVNASACAFGPPYDPSQSPTYALVPDTNFNVSYADRELVNGAVARERMALAGVAAAQQQFGVVDRATWYGDGASSGLVGFAYRALTGAYAGTDPGADAAGSAQPYSPLFASMCAQQPGLAPVFSLVLDRAPAGTGLLGLGGVPAGVAHAPDFARTPILPAGVNASSGALIYEYYTVEAGGFALAAAASPAQFDPLNTSNPLKTPLAAQATQVIVDSGTSLTYVPDAVAAALAGLFSPAATYDDARLAYTVDCDAVAPVFGVAIAEKIFYVNPLDLVVQTGDDECLTGVQPSLGGLSILGGTWLKNVVAVFDIGGSQMQFAAREFYSLYSTAEESV